MNIKITPLKEELVKDVYNVEVSAFHHPWSIDSFYEEIKNPLANKNHFLPLFHNI